jgi:PAS domain S-box-containing protein
MALPPRWSLPKLENRFHSEARPDSRLPDSLADMLRAMDAFPLGLAVTDAQGFILHINRRAREWLVREREEFRGARLDSLGGGTISEDQFRALLDTSLAGGWRGEVTCVRKDGSRFPVYLETSVLRDPDGESPLIVAVARDISEQRSLQARLIAEEKAGTLGLITRNIAHRVRNHLASINMSLYFLEEAVSPDGDGPTQIDTIRREMHRMRLFLDSLAAYALPPAPEFQDVSLTEVVNQGLDEARPVLRLKSVAVKRQFPADAPILRLDRAQFARAIAHVVQNSAESMEHPGSVHVVIKRRSSTEETRWLVEIRDDGSGIAPTLQDRVFEPFFTTSESQLGLGLTMVRRVMDLHGGEVSIESLPGQGSVVTLDLPVRSGAAA